MAAKLITLALAKQHLQISSSNTSENALVQQLLDAAEEFALSRTGISVNDGSTHADEYEETLDGGVRSLELTHRPVNSIVSITDVESDEEIGTWKVTKYRVFPYTDTSTWAKGLQRWKVKYKAGYTSATAPATLKGVILDLVYRAYWSRGGKNQQSADGFGYTFDPLEQSDLIVRLKSVSMKGRIG